MKKTLILNALIWTMSIALSNVYAQNEIYDNKKVVELTSSKLADDIIIGLINSNTCNFNCNSDAILELKNSGVSDKVIAEVVKICSNKNKTATDIENERKKAELDNLNIQNEKEKERVEQQKAQTQNTKTWTIVAIASLVLTALILIL